MPPKTPQEVLAAIEALHADHELSILRLSEPIAAAEGPSAARRNSQDPGQRTSDVSNASLDDAPTPASLEGDLEHYRELFAKLRFSYVEQVTKEKFIRAIVGDPPLIVTPQENLDLEAQNLEAKAALKALKTDVTETVARLEARALELSAKHERLSAENSRLAGLPQRIKALEESVAALRQTQEAATSNPNPDLNLPLSKTLELVEAKKRQRAELDRQLEQLQALVPRKKKELDRLHAELQPLETKRNNSSAAAREAKRRKDAALGGVEDDLEERGRWYRAADATLRQLLNVPA
ncbi:uncharacterized protein B0I36DRAFT_335504 [Microdochium trichocladiopsis]|uniref:Kinetochore protein Sos7 coiled-coil domain-containing protein n=1 Tax=Microdochium trichocladiopsis TaxID=1682393 RepID=A0A9P9BK78_9PEZI|nr:uncharacterized protein B0I36DRAFT_335504 [Microdochium trichocladiopsis]KAH7018211.1 hypothetical protein B0I36DRAFT_335504 [Microdochium trichocladiopsis]